MMNCPSALFVGSPTIKASSVIKKVFGSDLPPASYEDDCVKAFQWHIDNKYYETDINLCVLKSKIVIDIPVLNPVEAIVLCFNSNDSKGLEDAESWLPFLDVYDTEIKILVCGNAQEDVDEVLGGISKRTALEWCIQRGFELVELDPNTDDCDEEDDFPETTGVERIKQALNAHQWPNLQLKIHSASGSSDSPKKPLDLPNYLSEFSEYIDDFGCLFDQLAEMKERVKHLSGQERKDAAEQFVMSIWNALDSDDEDIGGVE